MSLRSEEAARIVRLLERTNNVTVRELELQHRILRGGLEARSVARVSARYVDHHGRRRVATMVVKQLHGAARREVRIYHSLAEAGAAELAPRLLGSSRSGSPRAALYLEAIRPTSAWPWKNPGAAGRVLEGVSRLHTRSAGHAVLAALDDWDYEAELRHLARSTIERIDRLPRVSEFGPVRGGLRWIRRIVERLPELRRQLLGFQPFGSAVIHGDLHPGNAMMRRRRGTEQPVLLDWGRARLGSPLEDVSSWLQSLRPWEPEARRSHDRLLGAYLSAVGLERRISTGLRAAYWLAGASNAMAGALLHHVAVMSDLRVSSGRRATAAVAARDWIRVLRRADAIWR